MFPILYEQITSGVIPQHNGLGVLSDAISCVVEQERNGIYELTMEYPISGIHAQELAKRRILKVKPNFTDAPQLFRIDRISGTLNGKFTVYAKHISYDLSGYVIARGTASNAIQAVNLLESAASGYNFDTDKNVTADFTITEPSSVRSWFAGKSGSFLDVFGKTELKYDNFNVHFLLNAGQDRGITIRYGKNLLALSQETDCNNLYTAVMCYFKEEDGTIIDGDEITTGLSLDVPKVMIIDCSDDFDEIPTVQELNQKAQQYINNNNLTLPTNNITLDFVQSGELSNRVDLCDTVSIYYEALGITRAKVKCIRTKWDCLKERYIETEFGDVKTNLTETITTISKEVAEKPSVTEMGNAISAATSLITGNSGGYVVLHDTNNDGEPDEILIMDTPDISTAVNVIRMNKNGVGLSTTGYEGTYTTAFTAQGIVADAITTGILNANLIKAGVISDAQGKSTIDMTNGQAKLYELSAIKGFNILTEGDEDVKATFSAQQFGTELSFGTKVNIAEFSRQGEIYANMGLSYDGTNPSITITALEHGGKIYAHNETGEQVAEVFARNDQRGGTVQVKDGSGNPAGYLTVDANGCGEFTLLEPTGDTRLHMFDNGYGGCLDLVSNAGTAVGLWADSTLCGHVHVENNAYEHTVELDGSKGEVSCLRILPYDPEYSVDNASGTMHLDASGWEVRRMGNVVYMSIPFKGTGVNVPAGSTAFTGKLADGDLPAIPCNMVAYYSGDVFILNIKASGDMTLRNCGAARTFSTNQGITVCGSFVVD